MKQIGLMLLILILTLSFAACGNGGDENQSSQIDELVIAIGGEPDDGFDPCLDWSIYGDPVFQSTLLRTTASLDLENDLAVSHEVSEDSLVWTYEIREDALFTDGSPVTAKDVAFTYMQAKETSGEHDLSALKDAVAVGDTVVEFHLSEPCSTFEYTTAVLGIVPAALYDDNYGRNPVGSGPYKLVEWNQGQQLIIERNDAYYGTLPYFKKITLLFSDEDQTYAYLRAGEVDIAKVGIHFMGEYVEGYQFKSFITQDSRGLSFPMYPAGTVTDAGLTIGNDVTSDPAIRKAMNYGLDRNALVEDVLNGYGTPTITDALEMPWLQEDVLMLNRALSKGSDAAYAREILEAGGWVDEDGDGILEKNGIKAEFNLIYSSGDSTRQAISLAVAEQMKEYGIKIHVSGKSWDDIYKSQYTDAILFGYGSRTPGEIKHLYHSEGSGNAGQYKNEIVDSYIKKALKATTPEKAEAYWKLAQWDGTEGSSLLGDAPWCWIVTINHNYYVRDGLNIEPQKIHSHDHGFSILSNVTSWNWAEQ